MESQSVSSFLYVIKEERRQNKCSKASKSTFLDLKRYLINNSNAPAKVQI